MKKIKFTNFGFAVLFLTGLASCNDSSDSFDENRDSLMRDSIDRADNTRFNDSASMQNKDAVWVSEVLESNFAEIELSKQAQQKATDKQVKDLAVMLEKDHMSLVNEAKDLASKKNWTVASGETTDAMKKREDMMDDQVKEYQKDWLEMMEDRHENSIKKFEDAADDVTDVELRSWITSTVPKLRAHHDRIMQVQKAMK